MKDLAGEGKIRLRHVTTPKQEKVNKSMSVVGKAFSTARY